MAKFELWYIGKGQGTFIEEAVDRYSHRLGHYTRFELVRQNRIKNGHKLSPENLMKAESDMIISKLNNSDYLITLDVEGSSYNSKSFSRWIEKLQQLSSDRVIFFIGGIYGIHDLLNERAQASLSLSKMTLPHELARLVFIEQLFRAFTILRNEPYHNP